MAAKKRVSKTLAFLLRMMYKNDGIVRNNTTATGGSEMQNETGVRIGSSKMMRRTDMPGQIEMFDRGTSSVFDRGPMLDFVSPEIAIARTTQADAIFRLLEHYRIATHYIRRESDTSLLVHESRVNNLPLLSGKADAEMFGVEVLCRLRATKKFCERFARGEIPEAKLHRCLLPGTRLAPGVVFTIPYVEFSTKWRPGGDVYLSDAQAAELTGGSAIHIQQVLRLGEQIASILDKFTAETDYFLDDFKFEVAYVFGTTEFRIIDGITVDEMGMSKGGELYGKNPIRFYLEEEYPVWVTALRAAKAAYPEDKENWPAYPPLPEWLKLKQIKKYEEVAADWSGWVSNFCS